MLPPANIDSVKGYVAFKPVSLSQVACEAYKVRQCWVQLSCLCICVVSWCACCSPGCPISCSRFKRWRVRVDALGAELIKVSGEACGLMASASQCLGLGD
jgi:hypothetical protein